MNWRKIKIDPTDTHFLYEEKPIFKEFRRVMSFHEEGLAAVYDETGAYHIDTEGQPAYPERYIEAFGYYGGLATVRSEEGYFHIDTTGQRVHSNHYLWSGNFQEGRCVVEDEEGFFHIDETGKALTAERFQYVGDFKYGIAVAHRFSGEVFHYNGDGKPLNDRIYRDAGVYHKGYAVVADERGYFHVDKRGNELYPFRFKRAEVFYNAWALCEEWDGRKLRIDEGGHKLYLPTKPEVLTPKTLLQQLKKGKKIGLFFRHSERFSSKGVLTENDVQLTEKGHQMAEELGLQLGSEEFEVHLYSSPIHRCVETSRLIKKGLPHASEIELSDMLGDPSVYFDREATPEEAGELERIGLMNYAQGYFKNLEIAGFRHLSTASQELEQFIIERMKAPLSLFNSHDLLVGSFMRYSGTKYPTREDFVDFLEGVAILQDPDGSIRYALFKPKE